MGSQSPETTGVPVAATEAAQSERPVTTLSPTQESVTPQRISGFNKLLARFGIKRGPKPLIEVKPAVAQDSEGRARIDRDQLKQKLEDQPAQS